MLERLRYKLKYDPETGWFTRDGIRAGTINAGGYRQLQFDGKFYYEHRLAWFYVYGEWPPDQIDHVDKDRANNALANLRLANQTQNNWNSKDKTEFRGAYWDATHDKWMSQVTINGRTHFLGRYDTAEGAHQAYMVWARSMRGEFFHQSKELAHVT